MAIDSIFARVPCAARTGFGATGSGFTASTGRAARARTDRRRDAGRCLTPPIGRLILGGLIDRGLIGRRPARCDLPPTSGVEVSPVVNGQHGALPLADRLTVFAAGDETCHDERRGHERYQAFSGAGHLAVFGMNEIGTFTSAQPPFGGGNCPPRNFWSTQLATEGSPSVSLNMFALQEFPCAPIFTDTSILPCNIAF